MHLGTQLEPRRNRRGLVTSAFGLSGFDLMLYKMNGHSSCDHTLLLLSLSSCNFLKLEIVEHPHLGDGGP